MNYLYLLLNIGSLIIPFFFSFHPKFRFYKLWKPLFISISINMLVFIPWDIMFTKYGIWGFNSDYFLGLELFSLPFEEWLFFICIPYACVFTHYTLVSFFPHFKLSKTNTMLISYSLALILITVTFFNFTKLYPLVIYSLTFILIVVVTNTRISLLRQFYLTFLIILIPFFIVNGILTGSYIENPVVWYNNKENLGLRIFTIPIEDFAYAFSLILINLFIMSWFEEKKA